MLSSQSVSDIETPYRLLHDIEDITTSDSNSRSFRSIEDVEIAMNTFVLPESKSAWYLFFGCLVLVLIGCIIYSIVV
jgi:hypothetical protein